MPATILQAVRTEAACQMHHRLPSLASGINTKKTHDGELRKTRSAAESPQQPTVRTPPLFLEATSPSAIEDQPLCTGLRGAHDAVGWKLGVGSWEGGARRGRGAELLYSGHSFKASCRENKQSLCVCSWQWLGQGCPSLGVYLKTPQMIMPTGKMHTATPATSSFQPSPAPSPFAVELLAMDLRVYRGRQAFQTFPGGGGTTWGHVPPIPGPLCPLTELTRSLGD